MADTTEKPQPSVEGIKKALTDIQSFGESALAFLAPIQDTMRVMEQAVRVSERQSARIKEFDSATFVSSKEGAQIRVLNCDHEIIITIDDTQLAALVLAADKHLMQEGAFTKAITREREKMIAALTGLGGKK